MGRSTRKNSSGIPEVPREFTMSPSSIGPLFVAKFGNEGIAKFQAWARKRHEWQREHGVCLTPEWFRRHDSLPADYRWFYDSRLERVRPRGEFASWRARGN